jgi:hypothetical protein
MFSILSLLLATLPITTPIASPPATTPNDLLPEQVEDSQEIVFLDEEEEADALFSDMEMESEE